MTQNTDLREIIQRLQYENDCFKIQNEPMMKSIKLAQNNKDYEYLIFSGGGVKGISFVGTLKILEELGILYDGDKFKIKGIGGVSAGSIVASLLAIGYKPDELLTIMKTLNFGKILDGNLGYIRDGINFLENWGICPGEYIIELMEGLIEHKTGNKNYTLENLMNDTGIKLVIVSADINCEKSVYLYAGHTKKKYSNISIVSAIRMSMGIPVIFEPYKYHKDLFIDGGTLDNYPLHIFDGKYPGDPEARLNLCEPNYKVLGIKITPEGETQDYDIVGRVEIKSLFDYYKTLIDMFLVENDRRIMTPSFCMRTIFIVTQKFPLTKFDINEDELDKLIEAGKNGAKKYFNR